MEYPQPQDTFKFVIPAELSKSDDGDWKIRGLASTDVCDAQGETVIQKGIDLTPIDKKKGIINFDHKKGPENTIGILDGYSQKKDKLFLEGRLFKKHTKAKAVKEIMDSLGESDRGRMGMSVEGAIVKRGGKNGKIIEKCVVTGVALTMNPVNSDTYVDFVKSLSADAVEIDAHQVENIGGGSNESEETFTASQVAELMKALGISGGNSMAPNTRSGGDALGKEDLDKSEADVTQPKYEEDEIKAKKAPSEMKKMSKSMYKASMINILDKLQVVYPEYSRSQIWGALEERLTTRYPSIQDVE